MLIDRLEKGWPMMTWSAKLVGHKTFSAQEPVWDMFAIYGNLIKLLKFNNDYYSGTLEPEALKALPASF